MIAPEVAVDKLAGFQTADEVARFLAGEGVTGVVGAVEFCPVAQWLRKTTGADRVFVYPGELHVADHHRDTPEAVARFISFFDSTAYPELRSS